MLKIYESLQSLYFATNIVVAKDDIRRIEFSGGVRIPVVSNGTFATEDKDLQNAIERDKSYGVKFKLKTSVEPGKKDDSTALGSTEKKNFNNVADAKEWLNKEKGVPSNRMTNKSLVISEAKDLGIELVFPD